jgi:hypothetical protein
VGAGQAPPQVKSPGNLQGILPIQKFRWAAAASFALNAGGLIGYWEPVYEVIRSDIGIAWEVGRGQKPVNINSSKWLCASEISSGGFE